MTARMTSTCLSVIIAPFPRASGDQLWLAGQAPRSRLDAKRSSRRWNPQNEKIVASTFELVVLA